MHLTFDCINGIEPPMSLPPTLIPPNKSHLLAGAPIQPQPTGVYPQQTGYHSSPAAPSIQHPQSTGILAQQTGYSMASYQQPYATAQTPQYTGFTQISTPPVEFSWDMTPEDMTTYQNIYSKYANETGKVRCKQNKRETDRGVSSSAHI